jgi:hypothetical protein
LLFGSGGDDMSGEERNSIIKDVLRKGVFMTYTPIIEEVMAAGLSESQAKRGVRSLMDRGEILHDYIYYALPENRTKLEEKVRGVKGLTEFENPLNVRDLIDSMCDQNPASAKAYNEFINLCFDRIKATDAANIEKDKVAEDLHRKKEVEKLMAQGYTRNESEWTYEWYIPKIRQRRMKSEQDMKREAEKLAKCLMAGELSKEKVALALSYRDENGAYNFNF